MSRWIADVTDVDGARNATKTGMFGALGFAATIALGIAFFVWQGHMPGEANTVGAEKIGNYVGIAIELLIVLFAAWRFRQGKGAYLGIVILLLFLGETASKAISRPSSVGWFFLYAVIIAALLNGIRGAWAMRRFRQSKPLAEVFE